MTDQVKTLHTIYGVARQHNVTDEELHDAIFVGFGKQSLKQLTEAEVAKLLDGIRGRHAGARRQAMARHGRRKSDAKKDATYLINARELELLVEAATLRGWSSETLSAFCRRQVGKDRPVTMAEYNKCLWPLKAMNRRDGLWRSQTAK
jgi:hypothetical protein